MLNGNLLAGLTQIEWDKIQWHTLAHVDYLKMRLAGLDISHDVGDLYSDALPGIFMSSASSQEEAIENLCAYYLGHVICKVQAWVLRNNADLVRNQEIDWSASLGVPVQYRDSTAINRFQRVLRLACAFSTSQPKTLQIDRLQEHMSALRNEVDARGFNYTVRPDDVRLEVIASIYSYITAVGSREGIYIFFDIGGGTLDGSAFRYWIDENEDKRINIYQASVQPIGINALTRQVVARLGVSESTANQEISGNSNSNLDLAPEIKLIQLLVARVIASAINSNRREFEQEFGWFDSTSTLPIFRAGGGARLSFYQNSITQTHSRF